MTSIWVVPTPVILPDEYSNTEDLIRCNDLQFLHDHRHDVLYVDRTQQTLANSTTKTAVATYVVPAGMLSSNGILTFRAFARVHRTSGSNSLSVDVTYGGTSLGQLSSIPNDCLVDIVGTLVADGATNKQVGMLKCNIGYIGLGDRVVYTNANLALAIDSTVDQNLVLHLTNSVASADADWTYFYFAVFGLP
jgi:hypothetical protein